MADKLNELLSEAAPIQLDEGAGYATAEETIKVPVSKTALVVDRWTMRQANQILREWKKAGLKGPDQKDEQGNVKQSELQDPHVVADTYASLFEMQPKFAANPEDPQRAAWLKQLMDSPDYAALHNQTLYDPDMAGIAAKSLCDQYTVYVQAVIKQGPPEEGGAGGGIRGDLPGLRSVNNALKNAQQDVQDAKDIQAGLGMGSGSKLDREEMSKAFKKIRGSQMLKQVMAMAGKLKSRCQSLQSQKLNASSGEITGIKLGRDISKLVPKERLALAGAMGEMQRQAAQYRVMRRRALCYQHKVKVPVGAGPIVVGIDESGSMSGQPIVFAKALGLTMGWLATQQDRWVALYGFDDGYTGGVAFPPGQRDLNQMIEWVEQFSGGGTTLQGSCVTVPNEMWPKWQAMGMPKGRTDHIIITDGCIHAQEDIVTKYKAWSEEEQVRTYGIVIGGYDAGTVASISQRHWCVRKLDMDCEAVTEMLSI